MSRATSDGSYWAHIARDRNEHEGSGAGAGKFLDSRVDYETRHAGDKLLETLEGDDLMEVRLALHPRSGQRDSGSCACGCSTC